MPAAISLIIRENNTFRSHGWEHAIVLAVTCLVLAGLVIWGRRLEPASQTRLGAGIGWFIWATLIFWTLVHLSRGQFDPKIDLPLVLCNFSAVLLPALMATRSRLMFEVLYFWVMTATMQAVLSPDQRQSFPHYTFFKFWIVHSGLVVAIWFTILVYGLRPTWASVWKSFLALHLYVAAVSVANYLLDANYFYLRWKPENPSPLDVMGPWPWYIVVGYPITLGLFLLAYLPFAIWRTTADSIKKPLADAR